jgi:uncharacterized membrane protein
VDEGEILEVARRTGRVVRLHHAVGDFVTAGTPLVALSGTAEVEPPETDRVRRALVLDRTRTIEQDPAYGIRQLVDVALKALSPGINDTTTAINCVDWLGAVLRGLTTREFPSSDRWEEGSLRVIAPRPDYDRYVEQAFGQIRQVAGANSAVLLRQLHVLQMLLAVAGAARRPVLLRQVALLLAAARRAVPEEERSRIERLARTLLPGREPRPRPRAGAGHTDPQPSPARDIELLRHRPR